MPGVYNCGEVQLSDETYRNVLETIARQHSAAVTVFADFCRMVACCLAAGTREAEYLEVIRPYSRGELDEFSRALALLVQEMERKPFTDVLGGYYLDVAAHSSKQARGEFYTPPEISQLMAAMVFKAAEVKERGRAVTLYEPACGSGGMVLALAQSLAPERVDLLRVTARDINPVAADMCYINLTLWGIPSQVILGNSLSGAVTRGWKNIHWMRVGEDQRQTIAAFEKLLASEPEAAPVPESVDLGEVRKGMEDARGQFWLDL